MVILLVATRQVKPSRFVREVMEFIPDCGDFAGDNSAGRQC